MLLRHTLGWKYGKAGNDILPILSAKANDFARQAISPQSVIIKGVTFTMFGGLISCLCEFACEEKADKPNPNPTPNRAPTH